MSEQCFQRFCLQLQQSFSHGQVSRLNNNWKEKGKTAQKRNLLMIEAAFWRDNNAAHSFTSMSSFQKRKRLNEYRVVFFFLSFFLFFFFVKAKCLNVAQSVHYLSTLFQATR